MGSYRTGRVVCHLITGELATLYRALDDRQVDALITGIPTPLADHLQAEVLYTSSRFVVASTENAWSRRRRVTLADLMNEPWTLPPSDSPHGAWAADDFRAAGLQLPRATVITYTDIARLALVAKGRFLSITGRYALSSFRTTIKALPIELAGAHIPVGILTLKNSTLTAVAQLFIDCAREVAKPMAIARRREPQKA
jgi:DNA-binding transcriptional LysR family regulator